jgi:hypothetical protein
VLGKKAFSDEYEELVPYSLSNQYYSILVGMGFDYLARFIVAQNLENTDVKNSVYRYLIAEKGLKRLENITEKKLYKLWLKNMKMG